MLSQAQRGKIVSGQFPNVAWGSLTTTKGSNKSLLPSLAPQLRWGKCLRVARLLSPCSQRLVIQVRKKSRSLQDSSRLRLELALNQFCLILSVTHFKSGSKWWRNIFHFLGEELKGWGELLASIFADNQP